MNFDFDADANQAFHSDADPDPASENVADPGPQHGLHESFTVLASGHIQGFHLQNHNVPIPCRYCTVPQNIYIIKAISHTVCFIIYGTVHIYFISTHTMHTLNIISIFLLDNFSSSDPAVFRIQIRSFTFCSPGSGQDPTASKIKKKIPSFMLDFDAYYCCKCANAGISKKIRKKT
jgi:hypothetical protein